MAAGIAKPSPSLPPPVLNIKVLRPTTLPSTSTSGPPLFPGFIGASVWIYTMGSSGSGCRATELTTPIVTEISQPFGAADRKHKFSLADSPLTAKSKRGQVRRLYLKERQVRCFVCTQQFGVENLRGANGLRFERGVRRRR